ncbi:PREDICTED: uncharacterized protein C3orf20-like isoform X1 [Myotis davidii]|uniref:uncharacterized protein C3orf20-like isoform X1 n=2 Tax=Myotis davidii TaxID=225400 RepID=UPI0007670633|nr:PREDICTED: uncharacterized protein C3orf20-like isoform X1 [Myotis davidii]XP_015415467.1 PREDICTED: uncharacterized protein C3orf20-like isoform X1 [Myotis davidii]XP_015415468.1 PREDICTED: uncharacterized protein C3orf20-like isoform X1 [Myotis davidii]
MKSEEHRRMERCWPLDSATELENPRLVTLSSNMSDGRMEDFTKTRPLDIGPIYFFDQMKPKKKKWEKRDRLPHLERTSEEKHSPTESFNSKEVDEEPSLSIVAASKKQYAFQPFAISPTPVVSKLSAKLTFSKIQMQKSLLEEYKGIAAELLCELGETLHLYAEYNIAFPVGIVNLVNYSWHDLIEEANKYETKMSMLKKQDALQSNSSCMIVDKISNYPIECHKENLMKTKRDHHHFVSIHPMKKISVFSQKQYSQIFQESNLPFVIHFSLSSKICLENGWILHYPHTKLEILKWKTVLHIAVKKLQEAIIQIKTEAAKLKKEGFNKRLILRHYNDPKQEAEVDSSPLGSQYFWLELLKGKPQMPAVQQDDPGMKKFHYALIDGSSMIYYPSGRVAVCQSYSALPWGGMYTNIFSDLPDQVILGTFTPFGCGSISFPKSQIISMMFNEDGGLVINKNGYIVREWAWPSKGKLDDPVEISRSSFSGAENTATFDTAMDISPMSDIATVIKLRRLQRKAKHILFNWLDYYKFSLGIECLHMCKVPRFRPKVVRKQEVSPAEFLLKPSAKEKDENKEYLLYRNTFLKLKGVFQPSPLLCIQKTPASKCSFRLPLPIQSKDGQFAPHLACPVVLRRMLCRKDGPICRCSTYSVPEVTDLEYDHLINQQLSSMDQIIIVYVFSAKEKDKTMKEVNKLYREQNKARNMPCTQSRLDSFRFLKYNIMSASKFTGSNYPLLVQRHNVVPGIFLMYIQGKLLFANFIFNGYSTSAKDLQKQIVKTRGDYHMGYFLPSDFRIRAQPTACFGNEDILL